MGLKERRITENFKNEKLKSFTDAAEQIAGCALNFDIKWDAFHNQLDGFSDANEAFDAYMSNMFFKPLNQALQSVCSDDMGREALKSALTKIEMLNTDKFYNGNGVSFDGGVLKLDFRYANEHDVDERAGAIQKQLENSL